MSAAYGIAGLVDGFVKGREIKHSWEDRKEEKARQKKLDEYSAAAEARAAEQFGWQRDENGRITADWERTRADDDALRKAQSDAIAAAESAGALGAMPDQGGAPTVAAQGAPATQARSTTVSASDAPPNAAAGVAMELGIAPPPPTPTARRAEAPREIGLNEVGAEIGPDIAGYGQGHVDPRLAREAGLYGERPVRDNAQPRPAPVEMEIGDVAGAMGADIAGYGQGHVDPRLAQAAGLTGKAPGRPDYGAHPTQAGVSPEFSGTDAFGRTPEEQAAIRTDPAPQAGTGPYGNQAFGDSAYRDPAAQGTPGYSFDQWRAMTRQQRANAGLPVSEIGGQMHFSRFGVGLGADQALAYGAPSQDPLPAGPEVMTQGPGQPVAPGADRAANLPGPTNARSAPASVSKYDQAALGGLAAYDKLPRAMRNEADRRIRAGDAAANADPRQMPGGLSDPAPADQPLRATVPASANPQAKAMADTAVSAMSAATTPAIQAAADATPAPLGAAKGGVFTEAQRNRAADDFLERYRTHGAPIVIKAMLRQGNLEGAMKFQEFMDEGDVKAGMRNWSRAAFAASVGDFDSFGKEIIEAYNRLDYFGDGTTIVEKDSGFTKDKDGNVTGAKLVFRDEATGNTFEQVFQSPEDLVKMGVTLLAPEEAFAYRQKQIEAETAAQLGAVEKSAKATADRTKRVDDLMKIILDQNKSIMDPTKQLTFEQARAMAEEQVARDLGETPAAGPSGPPVARRPN